MDSKPVSATRKNQPTQRLMTPPLGIPYQLNALPATSRAKIFPTVCYDHWRNWGLNAFNWPVQRNTQALMSSCPYRFTPTLAAFTLLTFGVVTLPVPGMAQLPNLSSPATTSTTLVSQNTGYTLGGGDRLRLDVFNVPEYSGEFQVLVDGTLNLPVVGSVPVAGLTLQEASDRISQRYARYVRRPLITLSLLAARPITLGVAGEVNRPGTYTVALSQTNQFPTVTQAITLAGGVRQSAAIGNVQIRRRTTDGGTRTINVNLRELLQTGDLTQDITLRDGDSIFIDTATAVDPAQTRQLADASFAANRNEPINVAVVGQVARPGPYAVTGGGGATGGATGAVTGSVTGSPAGGGTGGGPPTVTRAIQVAGGIKPTADIRNITIRRYTRSGSPQVINVNLWELLRGGDLSQDIILQDGDTIEVPTATAVTAAESTELAAASFSPNTMIVNVVGEVVRPGAIPVPPNTPLNQALLAAGGFNNRARRGEVELVRLNPDGTVSKRDVDVDFDQGISEENNPTLRNNDVIVVNRSGLARFTDTLGSILSPVGGIFSLFNFFRIFR